jgi:hypothetical protein
MSGCVYLEASCHLRRRSWDLSSCSIKTAVIKVPALSAGNRGPTAVALEVAVVAGEPALEVAVVAAVAAVVVVAAVAAGETALEIVVVAKEKIRGIS